MPEATVVSRPAHPFPDDDRYPSGWFTWEECELLAEWARGKLILELGTFLGRSTVAMARTAKHVVTVDHFTGSPLQNWYEPGDYLARTRENLHKYGVSRDVTIIAADFQNLMSWLKPGAFDGALVDGAHDSVSVMLDTGIAADATGSYRDLVWDDYSPWWRDVTRFVSELARQTELAVTPLVPGSKLVRLS